MKKHKLIICFFLFFFPDVFSATSQKIFFTPFSKNNLLCTATIFPKSVRVENELSSDIKTSRKLKNIFSDSLNSGKDLFLLPELETWLVWWHSYNYLSTNTIKPGFFFSPSIALKYKKFTYKLSFISDFGSSSIFTSSINTTDAVSLQAGSKLLGIEGLKYSKKFSFESKLIYGTLKGSGSWSYYEDTINFNVVYKTININSKTISTNFLIGFNGKKPWIGLKYIHYNTPAYMVGKEVVDPRDSTNSLIWASVIDTKFTHFFIVFDPIRYAIKGFDSQENNKQVQFNLQGHTYTLFGFGYAQNDTLGKVTTSSFPFQSSATSSTLLPFGLELDLGVRMTIRTGKQKSDTLKSINQTPHFTTSIGFRYTNWSIISFIKKDLQLRSNEFYWGPYLMLAFQF